MTRYRISIKVSVYKKLEKLPSKIESRIVEEIQSLAANPRPAGCKKLKGLDGYRIRVGDYRIVYQIKDSVLIILVLDIGHRKNIYK
ncbi:MAG: type toxin-antitoxin system RelE/ParE family toxin [Sphingobacteriaceae bacterium]|jgi:mRNA interferase RelE/StbE|nr:type toxin-antitoxin system RelE/ParE family toxin [Sphingobacteriaceae bacterium]